MSAVNLSSNGSRERSAVTGSCALSSTDTFSCLRPYSLISENGKGIRARFFIDNRLLRAQQFRRNRTILCPSLTLRALILPLTACAALIFRPKLSIAEDQQKCNTIISSQRSYTRIHRLRCRIVVLHRRFCIRHRGVFFRCGQRR